MRACVVYECVWGVCGVLFDTPCPAIRVDIYCDPALLNLTGKSFLRFRFRFAFYANRTGFGNDFEIITCYVSIGDKNPFSTTNAVFLFK